MSLDDDYLLQGNESYAPNHGHLNELHYNVSELSRMRPQQVQPSYDGRSSWFAYEDAIDDWCGITELDNDKRGPALRNRLEGEAAIHKKASGQGPAEESRKRSEVLQDFLAAALREGRGQCFPLPPPAVHELAPRERKHASLDYQVSTLCPKDAGGLERHLPSNHGPDQC